MRKKQVVHKFITDLKALRVRRPQDNQETLILESGRPLVWRKADTDLLNFGKAQEEYVAAVEASKKKISKYCKYIFFIFSISI